MEQPNDRPRIDTIDLEFQGTPHVIASFVVHGPQGVVLVETGPGSTTDALLAGLDRLAIRASDVKDVLLTHIHLDHAGAAGYWARRGARIFVHPLGAPHLIDPSRLIASATRIYGSRMQQLWGEILAAPAERVVAVEDGTVIEAGGLRFRAIDTPGHARHHHVYVLGDVAFTGDATGIQLPGHSWIDLPAPPPEFDLQAWKRTLETLRSLGLRAFYRTHFGGTSNVEGELAGFSQVLERAVGWIEEMLAAGLAREAMIAEFSTRMRDWAARSGTGSDAARAYELANPRDMSVDGIARYLGKLRGG